MTEDVQKGYPSAWHLCLPVPLPHYEVGGSRDYLTAPSTLCSSQSFEFIGLAEA